MISDIIGLCRMCHRGHELPLCGSVFGGQKFKFTVYNTICSSCVVKVDYILKNYQIFNKEDETPIQNADKKIVMVDAATKNHKGCPNHIKQSNVVTNFPPCEENPILENTFSNEQVISSTNCVKENLQETKNQEGRKNQRCLECEYCKKKFTHTGDLNKHRRIHTGERPFDCPVCKRKFSHRSNLARHKRLHSGEKPYSCPLKCGKTFNRKDKLSNHITKQHPNT